MRDLALKTVWIGLSPRLTSGSGRPKGIFAGANGSSAVADIHAGTDLSSDSIVIQEGYPAMLVLSRKKNESIVINNDITITVVEIRGDKVRLGIVAPKEVPVHRQEVYEAIHGKPPPVEEPTPAPVVVNTTKKE